MANRKPDELCAAPWRIALYRGPVVLNGPGDVALAMTADAAEKSGEMLLKAAQRARRGNRSQVAPGP